CQKYSNSPPVFSF
nr:immunoglobulin light chain junction region [Macaca mulatta]